MAGTVLTEDRNGVRTVTLNRPERLNALNRELLDDLCAALDAALADEQVGALVLCGAGRAFCSGDDLKDFEDQTGGEAVTRSFIESIQTVTRRIVLGDKIVVGAIHGWAVGGGLEWTINCDLAVFAESAKCFFPEIKWGMFPTGGVTAILPRIVGLAKTRELMLLGESFGAAEALEMGLAWKVVPDDVVSRNGVRGGGADRRIAKGCGAGSQAGAQPRGLTGHRGRAEARNRGDHSGLSRSGDDRAGASVRRLTLILIDPGLPCLVKVPPVGRRPLPQALARDVRGRETGS